MHAGIRRVPAERARHAKRLGHTFPVLAASAKSVGPIAITPATQQGPTTTSASFTSATSAINSLGSALASSLVTSSSSPASSATTSSTSSVINTQPLPSSASSASFVTSPVVLTSTFATPSPTSTPQANVTHSGLSGGAIAGIIAGAALVGAALVVLFVRKTYLRRRDRKHISWSGAPGVGPDISDESKFPDTSERRASLTSVVNTPQRTVPPSPFSAHGQSMYSTPVTPLAHIQPPAMPTYPVPIPPPATYNNPAPVAYPTHLPTAYGPGSPPTHMMAPGVAGTGISSILPSVRASRVPTEAIVKCTFVPNLPDELSITTGERVVIVEQYDDGWDLCTNVRGERGMVPRECLEHVRIDQPDVTWRNVGRTSSLNPDGQRY